jgi:hypothetical protein
MDLGLMTDVSDKTIVPGLLTSDGVRLLGLSEPQLSNGRLCVRYVVEIVKLAFILLKVG